AHVRQSQAKARQWPPDAGLPAFPRRLRLLVPMLDARFFLKLLQLNLKANPRERPSGKCISRQRQRGSGIRKAAFFFPPRHSRKNWNSRWRGSPALWAKTKLGRSSCWTHIVRKVFTCSILFLLNLGE